MVTTLNKIEQVIATRVTAAEPVVSKYKNERYPEEEQISLLIGKH